LVEQQLPPPLLLFLREVVEVFLRTGSDGEAAQPKQSMA
jgi:hypothetical protein